VLRDKEKIKTEMLNLYWNIGKIIMEIEQGQRQTASLLYERLVLSKDKDKIL
jgi:hypothetical protein